MIIRVIHGCIILHQFRTSANIHSHAVVYRVIFKQNIIPVIRRIYIGGIPRVSGALNFCQGISRSSIRITRQQGFIIHAHISFRVYHLNLFRWHRSHRFVTHRGVHASRLTFFCGHQNNPVCPPGSIHRRGRSILQHGKTFNILWNHTSQVQTGRFYPIDQNQRFGRPIRRTDTPDVKLCIHLFFCQCTRSTSRLPTNNTGNFSGQTCGQVTTG